MKKNHFIQPVNICKLAKRASTHFCKLDGVQDFQKGKGNTSWFNTSLCFSILKYFTEVGPGINADNAVLWLIHTWVAIALTILSHGQ